MCLQAYANKIAAVVVRYICYCELQLNACASNKFQYAVLISYQTPNSSQFASVGIAIFTIRCLQAESEYRLAEDC